LKTYGGAEKLAYMDSSINLAQDDVRRVLIPKSLEHSPLKFRDDVVQIA